MKTLNPDNRLLNAYRASKKAFIYIGVFSIFVNLLMLTVPIYMLQIFDRVIAGQSTETLIFLTIIAVIALVTYAVLDNIRQRILTKVSSWMDSTLSPEALAISVESMLKEHTYQIQSLRDLMVIRSFVGSNSILTFFDSPWVFVYLFVIYYMHTVLGVVGTIGAVIIFGCALANEYFVRKPLGKANELSRRNLQYTESAVNNAEVIQSMGMLGDLQKRWVEANDEMLAHQEVANNYSNTITSTSKFVRFTIQLCMLGTGAYLVILNQITPGVMIAASILLSRALAPVEMSIAGWKNMLNAHSAHKRLKVFFDQDVTRTAGIKLPSPEGKLSVENVLYLNRLNRQPIINHISFQLNPGSMLALIGPTSSGKTTIARLIVGVLKPDMGVVRLDNADVYSWDREDFGQHVGYLPQDIELFSGSIKDNIARLSEADDEAVIKAAKLAGVHDIILRTPDGYNTLISPRQYSVSGGLKQRIGLARALYKDPKLIVLDEPNSNLDHEGEVALMNALNQMKAMGSTILLITHRPSIIKDVDEVIIIKDGRIHTQGSRDEIMQQMKEIAQTHGKDNKPNQRQA